MAANVTVSYEEMEQAAKNMVHGQAEVESQLNTIAGQAKSLQDGGFVTDKAGPAFQDAFDDFHNGMKTAIAGLTEISTYLTNAAANYRATDEANTIKR